MKVSNRIMENRGLQVPRHATVQMGIDEFKVRHRAGEESGISVSVNLS